MAHVDEHIETAHPAPSAPSASSAPAVPSAPPAAPAAPERRTNREWLAERISCGWARGVLVAWMVLFTAGTLLEPPTDNTPVLLADILGWMLLAGMLAAAVGLVARRRWGLVASLGASVLLVAASIACPTTGHHAFGLWWVGQLACALGLVGISAAALRRA